MRNLLLTIKYDGTQYHGWQRQPNAMTIQGEVERVLSILCAMPIEINGTSRTDAGVHALGQRASFKGEFAIPTANIKRAANSLLDDSIQIVDIEEMNMDFHARYDSKGKTYRYVINNAQDVNPFRRNYEYTVVRQLDVDKMRKASKYIVGKHDFACFQAAGSNERETTVRTISDITIDITKVCKGDSVSISANDEMFAPCKIIIEITGDGFLYNMVRIIVGTLVEIGLGKMEPAYVKNIIDSKDRRKAGHTAPPQGLYLKEIYYE